MRWKEPTLRHSHQHRHRHAQEHRTRRDAEQHQAFQRQPPPIVNRGAPGAVGCADEGGEALEGGPDQDEKRDRARLLARFDHTGDGVKNVALHLATNRDVAFQVGDDLFAGPVPVNKRRGNRDEQDRSEGNSEKNALKANAPAHCAPSIRKNLLTASKVSPRPGESPGQACSACSRGPRDAGLVLATLSSPAWALVHSFQGDFMNSVGCTPSRWRAARYWVLIISLTFVGLEILTKCTSGVVSSAVSTVMVP